MDEEEGTVEEEGERVMMRRDLMDVGLGMTLEVGENYGFGIYCLKIMFFFLAKRSLLS